MSPAWLLNVDIFYVLSTCLTAPKNGEPKAQIKKKHTKTHTHTHINKCSYVFLDKSCNVFLNACTCAICRYVDRSSEQTEQSVLLLLHCPFSRGRGRGLTMLCCCSEGSGFAICCMDHKIGEAIFHIFCRLNSSHMHTSKLYLAAKLDFSFKYCPHI